MEKISQYLEDRHFIEWVFNPTPELEDWWKSLETENPLEKENIQLARRILQKLRTKDRELPEDEKILLFTRILKQVEEHHHIRRQRRIFSAFFKYAAVALLFFAIGALVFYQKDRLNPQFYAQNISEPAHDDEARLIRPGGEDILLREDKSIIEHRLDGQVVVNDEVIESDEPEERGTPEMNQLVIPYGKTSELLLPDGTKVYLNAGSRLVYPEFFVDQTREVFLVGEGFFEVKSDVKHPFVVQTTDIRIKVLGTRFNVSAYSSDNIIETVLTEGEVRLEQNKSGFFSETTDLMPGQLAAFHKKERVTRMREVNTENYILWKEGLFKFDSSDLSRVIKKLERYYNIRFIYEDPLLGTIEISGKLDLREEQDGVIGNVASAANVLIQKTGEKYYKIGKKE